MQPWSIRKESRHRITAFLFIIGELLKGGGSLKKAGTGRRTASDPSGTGIR
jgi:hypothetical protein